MLTLNTWEDRYVVLSCPYVLSLKIYGWIEHAWLLNISSVVDASIFFSYRFMCEQKQYDDVSWLLQKVSHCKTFSTCASSILGEGAKWIRAYEFDGEKYWDSQEATFPCLETIMIYGYVNEPYVIQMVKFLLRSATRLQKLVISAKKSLKPSDHGWLIECPIQFTSEQLQELSQKFESLPRASSEATIYLS